MPRAWFGYRPDSWWIAPRLRRPAERPAARRASFGRIEARALGELLDDASNVDRGQAGPVSLARAC